MVKGGRKTRKADPEKKPGRKSKAELIEQAILRIEEKLASDEMKASIGDFIRLLQVQKELEADQPREIKITWVDPVDKKSSSGK
ncbi:MAG: hypothetical protein WD696_16560 [Bryobacteraceae bacterium]